MCFCAQRQLGEAKQEVERERTKLRCTVEQLTTAQEHVAHLKEEVCTSAGSFYYIHSVLILLVKGVWLGTSSIAGISELMLS